MQSTHRHPPERQEPPAVPAALAALVGVDALDAELGALLWVLLEGGCPLVVAAKDDETLRRRTLGGLVEIVAAHRRLVGVLDLEPGDGPDAYALAGDVGGPPYDPATARAVAGAMSVLDRGLGLALAIDADSLEEVLAAFRGPGVLMADARSSYLGVVLVLEHGGVGQPRGRVRIAHYLRPLARDVGGHVQRLAPAVLAARDERSGRLEHFAWGVAPELADRIGWSAADLERETALRAEALLAEIERIDAERAEAERTAS